MIVVDVNILAALLLEGPRTRAAQALRNLDPEWIVPPFWAIDYQSILWKCVRFQRLPLERALALQDDARSLFGPNEQAPAPDRVLREAVRFGVSVYDAQYVALAAQHDLVCVTEDAELRRKCPAFAVAIESILPRGHSLRESKAAYGRRPRKTGNNSEPRVR